MKRPFELIEHTADIIVKAYGDTVAEAFAAAAVAMFSLIVDGSPIATTVRRELTVDAIDNQSLLVQFLSELIVLHDSENLVFGRFDLVMENDFHLQCAAWGELFSESKHQHGLMVKAVSYHLMEICEPSAGEPASVKVLFDI